MFQRTVLLNINVLGFYSFRSKTKNQLLDASISSRYGAYSSDRSVSIEVYGHPYIKPMILLPLHSLGLIFLF